MLKQQNITDIKSANEYLTEFVEQYNNKFSLPINNIKNSFKKCDEIENIDFYLARRFERKVNNGGAVKYMNRSKPNIYKAKTFLFVVKTFDNKLYANSYSE